MRQFSIIIPTLNEAGNIRPLLSRIQGMAQQYEMEPEILFVDDGSSDGTCEQIERYDGPLQVTLIQRHNERGLTGAVVAGAHAASCDLIAVMDSDLSHPPEAIPALHRPLKIGSHDMVIGSRYVEGGATPGWPRSRQVASCLASFPARLLTGVCDPLAGFFAVQKQHLTGVNSDLTGFKIGLEVIVKGGSNFRVCEVPISFQDRAFGQSKMTTSILGKYLRQLVRLSLDKSGGFNLLTLMATAVLMGLLDASLFSFFTNLGYGLDTSHISSFLIAAYFGYVITPVLHHNRLPSGSAGSFLRFTVVILLALCLRGSVLALPAIRFDSSPLMHTLFPAFSTFLSLPVAILISRHPLQTGRINWKVFGILLIGYTILLRLMYLGSIELIQEEAYYWNYSQHMAPGYLDHPPMVALLIRFGTMLFGNNELGVRFGAFICWFITAFYTYRLTHTIFNRDTAFRAVILVAALPIFFGVAVVITPDAPLIACWSGALYYLCRALVQEQRHAWYGAGIWLGLGLASKYTIVFLGPAIVLYMLLNAPARKWFLKPQPYLAAIVALAVFSPVIWWNYQHDWASFLFQSQGRLQASPEFSTHELLASILVLLTPTGFLAAVYTMRPQLARLEFLTSTLGNLSRRNYLFGLTMVIIPLMIFILFSLTREIKLNWTGPLWLSLLPFMACTMAGRTDRPSWLVTRLWPGTLVMLVLGYGTLLHYCAIGLPGLSYGNGDFLFGWEDLAQQVEERVQTIAAREGERPVVAGMDHYRIASGLAFYRNKQMPQGVAHYSVEETTGSQLFGGGALMYNYWYPPALASDRDILVIAHNKEQLEPADFGNHYQKLGDIGEITLTKRGKKAGRYYYRLLTWYTPNIAEGRTSKYVPPETGNRLRSGTGHNETTAADDITGAML